MEIVDGDQKTVIIPGSDLIKAVTNVLHLTKSVDVFDVEDKHHSYLQQLCPSVSVKPSQVKKLHPKLKVMYYTYVFKIDNDHLNLLLLIISPLFYPVCKVSLYNFVPRVLPLC